MKSSSCGDSAKKQLKKLKADIAKQERELDEFNFFSKDDAVSDELVAIGNEIAYWDSQKYALNYEIDEANKILGEKVKFDLDQIEEIFNDACFYFGDQIKKDYQDLVAFNEGISKDRNEILGEQLQKHTKDLEEVNKKLKKLNKQRQDKISFLKETDVLAKYRFMQKEIGELKIKQGRLEFFA